MSLSPSTVHDTYTIGFSGTGADIAAIVTANKPDTYHVLRGAIDAYMREGRIENIQAYLKTFMTIKVQDIVYFLDRTTSGQNYWMGQECRNDVTFIAMKLVEQADAPLQTLARLLAPMTDHERTVALNMIITSSTWHNHLITLNAALTLRAPSCTDCGYAVYVAADTKNLPALHILYRHDVDFSALQRHPRFSFGDTNYTAIFPPRMRDASPLLAPKKTTRPFAPA